MPIHVVLGHIARQFVEKSGTDLDTHLSVHKYRVANLELLVLEAENCSQSKNFLEVKSDSSTNGGRFGTYIRFGSIKSFFLRAFAHSH